MERAAVDCEIDGGSELNAEWCCQREVKVSTKKRQGKVDYQKLISNIKEVVEKCIKEEQINEIFSNKNAQQTLLNKTINKKVVIRTDQSIISLK